MAEAMAWDSPTIDLSPINGPAPRSMSFRTAQKSFSPILRKARSLLRAPGVSGGVQGHIDAIHVDGISGWVRKRGDDAPLEIDLVVDGRPLRTSYAANLLRPDLRDAGLGDGRFGFDFAPLDLEPGPDGRTLVEIRLAGAGTPLLRTVADLSRRPRREPAALPRAASFELQIDSATPSLLSGWAVDRLSRGNVFEVDVLIDGTPFCRTRNDQPRPDLQDAGRSDGLGGIRVELPLDLMELGPHEVALAMPHGQTVSRTVCTERQRLSEPRRFADLSPGGTAVIVPVYNAADDLRTCIERLAAHTPGTAEILFIDDASPDPRIAPLLDAAAARPNMRVLRNAANLGFTRTVNRGIAETGAKDVILLNSDARVTPGWLEGMLRAARARPRVATVTAMSDRAGAFSAPDIGNGNALPPGVDEITYAKAVRLHGLGLYPLVPTGNGFCMFVRRACLDEVGALDAEAFPRGYGEENDFCMRAGRAGWRHVIDDCTYVFHDRSKSFGEAKADLIAAGRAVVDARYPEYTKSIAVFRDSPQIALARFRARQALRHCGEREATLPKALFVVSTQTGGTPQTNLDLMMAFEDVLDGWLLRCDTRAIELSHVRRGAATLVRRHQLSDPVDAITHLSPEYDEVVTDWLRQLDPDIVHIRHIAWHSLSLPRIAKDQGAAVVFSFHDFYTVCPTIKLLDETGTFCGGRCTASSGADCEPELWAPGSFPPLKNAWVRTWRERLGPVLAQCDTFVTTSESARATVLRNLSAIPAERFHVIPHGRDFKAFARLRDQPRPGTPLRILVPGNINGPKGLDIIFQLLDHDVAGQLEFHVVGRIAMRGREPHPRLICHGTYERDDFADMAAKAAPHLGAVFSIWDETYCHTLTELWSVGLPALVFDFPTVANRVRATGAGWVVPHGDITALHDEILRIAFDPEEQRRADAALVAWQAGEGASRTTRMMAADYLDVYRAALGRSAPRAGATPGPSPVLHVAVVEAAGLDGAPAAARLRERTRNALDRSIDYTRMAPATFLASLRAGAVDAAILQASAIPSSLASTLLEELERADLPYLLDMDDGLPDGPELRDLMAGAQELTVSTPSLLAASREMNPNVHLLPDRVSGSLWGGPLPERRSDGLTRALGIGSLTHPAGLGMIRPALKAAAAAHPDFRLSLIGAGDDDLPPWIERIATPDEARPHRRFIPWLREQMSLFDFALAPREDDSADAPRSPLTLLDTAALGLPVLCSDTPAYRSMAETMPGATLVRNAAEAWTDALDRRIAAGRRSPEESRELRVCAFEHHLLEPTLPAFDTLVRSMTRRAASSVAARKRMP